MLVDPCPVDVVIEGERLTVERIEIEVVSLAGHSPNQLGFLIDGIFFCADVVLPETALEKYRIPYLYSVTDHLAALDRAMTVSYSIAVPGHGPRVPSLDELIELNRSRVLEVAEEIVAVAQEPMTAEQILTHLLRCYEAPVADAPSFYLLHPTVYAFLTHLEREGRVTHRIENGQLLWLST